MIDLNDWGENLVPVTNWPIFNGIKAFLKGLGIKLGNIFGNLFDVENWNGTIDDIFENLDFSEFLNLNINDLLDGSFFADKNFRNLFNDGNNISGLISNLRTTITGLNNDKDNLNTRLTQAINELTNKTDIISNLNTILNGKDSIITGLNTSINELHASNNDLRGKLSDLNTKLSSLSTKLREIFNMRGTLNKKGLWNAIKEFINNLFSWDLPTDDDPDT